MDEIIRAVSGAGAIIMSAVSSREIAARARTIHKTTPVMTAALGRLLAAAAMIGYNLKDPKAAVTLRINGGGPAGTLLAVSDSSGNPRGYVQNPFVQLPKKPNGKLDVGGAVGTNGTLTVIRDLNMKEPYVGSVRLVSGEIAEDLTAYFYESEQISTAVALGVLVETDLTVAAAGGYIVQLLPGAQERGSLLDALEKNIADTGAVTTVLRDGTAETLVRRILDGFEPRIIRRSPVEYKCYCGRKRVLEAVSGIGQKEIDEMLDRGEPIEVACQFCDMTYKIDPAEIAEFRKRQ